MEREGRLAFVVGLFALGGLAAFALAVLTLTSQRGFWTPRYRLVTHFENVQGLVEGAPVRLAGKDVGNIERVSFAPLATHRPPVRVDLLIDSSVQERIRSDSVATIGTVGLLGDKYVEIGMGTLEGTVLADGAELPATTPLAIGDVMQKGTVALDHVARLAGNVNEVVEELGEQIETAQIARSAQALADIAREVQEGSGLLHSLIYDPYRGGSVESIGRSLAMLESILDEVTHGQGVLHSLIYEPPSEQDVVMEAIEAGARLNTILARIERGEGTLGLLLSDSTLYEDLKLLVSGAQRSLLVRSLIELTGEEER